MNDKMSASRRQALGMATVVVAGAMTGGASAAAAVTAPRSDPNKPTDAELARVMRLYGGEFGGSRGER